MTTKEQPGTGERFNTGKPNYGLILPTHLIPLIAPMDEVWNKEFEDDRLFLVHLEHFIVRGNLKDLWSAYMLALLLYNREVSPDFQLDGTVEVWEMGAKKYSQYNWMKGFKFSTVVASLQRHWRWMYDKDQMTDDESGLHHWNHILCNIQMLIFLHEYYPSGNDLPHNVIEFEDIGVDRMELDNNVWRAQEGVNCLLDTDPTADDLINECIAKSSNRQRDAFNKAIDTTLPKVWYVDVDTRKDEFVPASEQTNRRTKLKAALKFAMGAPIETD